MKWLIFSMIIFTMSSCISYPLMHYSMAQNVPLLTQKNELRLSAATGTETIGIQGAYAFSKSFAVMGSYSGGMNDIFWPNYYQETINNGSRRSGELAIGYFDPITQIVVLEIYGGTERYYRNYSVTQVNGANESLIFSVNSTKPFVQLDLGFHNTSNNGLGLSIKFGYLMYDHYSYMELGGYTNPNKWTSVPYYVVDDMVIEPCLTYRVGGKRLSFQSQIGASITNSYQVFFNFNPLPTDPFFINVGLSLRLFGEKDINK